MADQFEELRVWKTARKLTQMVYALSNAGLFEKDWTLKDQIRRAAISVMSNIAEGFESRTRALFVDFLGRAKASAGEVRCQLYVALDQDYIDSTAFEEAQDLADKTSRQLYRLMRYLEQSGGPDHVREFPEEYVSR